jgi:protein SCO1/2
MMKLRLELCVISSILLAGLIVASLGTSTPKASAARLTSLLDRSPATAKLQYQHLRERATELGTEAIPEFKGVKASDRFPEVLLVNQDGQSLNFKTDLVSNRTTCFAMFYTRCTGSCPGTISKMLKIRESLTSQFGRDNIQFVCITLDPENDSPETLRQYAESVGALGKPELADIHFCTGAPEDLELVRRALGMYDLDPEVDADRSQHAAMIVIGNDRYNRWASAPSGLPVAEIHETCLRIAGTTERQRFGLRLALDSGFKDDALADIADAPVGFSAAAAAASEGSCCSKKDSADACCKDKAAKGACCSEKTAP